MKLQTLLNALSFTQVTDQSINPEIKRIEQDTRKVAEGTLFICIEGTVYDGHQFAREAEKRGAVAIVAKKPVDVNVPVVYVQDTKRAMAILASAFYQYPSEKLNIIGVTGTNGKTSVSHMIEHIFQTNGKSTGLIGTLYTKYNNETFDTKNTTPDSITLQKLFSNMIAKNVEFVSMEVSSHALVQGRVWGTDFDVAVFTNLTQDHLDYHKTMDEYRFAKGLLFSQLGNTYSPERKKFAILNADDEASRYFETVTGVHILTYGIERQANIRATNIRFFNKGTSFTLQTPEGKWQVTIPLIGKFNVYNSLAAISVGFVYDIPMDRIIQSFTKFPGVPGRLELVDGGQSFGVIVDYAHTPDSLENVLKTVRSIGKGRLFVVVGCGGDRDRLKRPIMAKIACKYATDPIFTSDNPRSEDPMAILKEMEEGVKGLYYKVIPDRKEAIQWAIRSASKDDIVLIAGKGHETYQIIGDQKIDFDDRLVAREAIRNK
ncbi:UDP-N-acetylmuramoyl-L-alanyl-D-glutamate--2,6-diaminopimelate ligase [Fervidibacillus halotolerans]|uniref:UDP-N-acetylmuramoyl-L-alanyl-D-glutamate--2,6-diaminopimelate ligase n=1 Tax=Fervidibacillus halotolerans TaxID=2980027 RepID=A0A9E8M1X4_9BACI|nr:UDP-N-acetylmuramoyl-L-alanyl-D-glutamate--2,6-diaminopimelate ligase [Fervidibacillus halotolerans]WAA13686.1 UDP-N-acetylmuramoyl-L-alanyl-D-glutamate--2,6-diaminopimelate ligase [Fervidibacillus halotolerans]